MKSAVNEFSRYLAHNHIPVAIPGHVSEEPILYLAAFSPQSYVKYYNQYRDHTKVSIALCVAAQKNAKENGVVTWSAKKHG